VQIGHLVPLRCKYRPDTGNRILPCDANRTHGDLPMPRNAHDIKEQNKNDYAATAASSASRFATFCLSYGIRTKGGSLNGKGRAI
jgi:hypothetical protein